VQACLLACCADVVQVQVVIAGVAVVCICSAGLLHSVGVVPAVLAEPCCPWCITPALHVVYRPWLCGPASGSTGRGGSCSSFVGSALHGPADVAMVTLYCGVCCRSAPRCHWHCSVQHIMVCVVCMFCNMLAAQRVDRTAFVVCWLASCDGSACHRQHVVGSTAVAAAMCGSTVSSRL
jgi:hypothetical protein